MALANELVQGGNDPEHLEVTAKVTLDEKDGAPTVTTSELTVTGRVPGIDQSAFAQAAETAGQNCPVSRALAGVDDHASPPRCELGPRAAADRQAGRRSPARWPARAGSAPSPRRASPAARA